MKRLFTATFILYALHATSNAQAALWNWSFDGLAGTFTTISQVAPYEAGGYTLLNFNVSQTGTTGLPTGSTDDMDYFKDGVYGFQWDGMEVTDITTTSSDWYFCTSELPRASCEEKIVFEPTALGPIGTAFGPSETESFGPLQISPVPIPAAAWLFMSGLIGLVWKSRKARKSVA